MLQPRDPSAQDALMMGVRVLALLLGLGGAATFLLLRAQPDEAPRGGSVPRVAQPVFVPTPEVDPPPAAAPLPASSVRSPFRTRDLGAPPGSWVREVRGLRPADLCAVLGAEGWRMTGWTAAEIDPERDECIGERAFGTGADATNAFAILRGGADGSASDRRVRELRMKLNVLDPATRTEAAASFAATLRNLFGRLGWDLPPGIETALRSLSPVEASLSGTHLRFWREPGEVPRFNLVVELPPGPPPVDRFAPRPLPPLPPARPGPARLSEAGEVEPAP